MDNLNQAPFYVGQRVAAINTVGCFKKGSTLTTAEVFQCPDCGRWHVRILEFPGFGGFKYTCEDIDIYCGRNLPGLDYKGAPARYFAPITERYADITSEIAQSAKQTNEVPDKFLIPETINN